MSSAPPRGGMLPHFAAMFLGAFNDNLYKSALVILVTYGTIDTYGIDKAVLVSAASGVLILPFILFSPLAAVLADRCERSMLIRGIKFAEIVVMSVGLAGFIFGDVLLLITVLFAMGAQSALYGPLKYGVVPDLAGEEGTLRANAVIETGTFFAVLFGTIAGGSIVIRDGGAAAASACTIGTALLGWMASKRIPRMEPPAHRDELSLSPVSGCIALVRGISSRRDIFYPVIARSWFYFIGSVFLAQFPLYARISLGADGAVATSFLAIFSIGIGAGTFAYARISGGRITPTMVPISACAFGASGVLLYILTPASPHAGELLTVWELFGSARGAAICAAMFAASFAGGVYVVPLTSMIQRSSGPELIARAIAAANITDSLFIVASAAAGSLLLGAGISVPGIFLIVSIMTALFGIAVRSRLIRKY